MKAKIKELRIKIDGLAQLTKELNPPMNVVKLKDIPSDMDWESFEKFWYDSNIQLMPVQSTSITRINSKEIEKAVDSLYLAKAWLGKILEELGEESPYKSGKKTVEDIESTADVSHPYMGLGGRGIKFWIDKNHVEKIDWLRSQIDRIISLTSDIKFQSSMEETLITFSYKYLCEAKFQLGFELGRVRKEEK